MKREQILERLGYIVPENKKVRVIIHSDAKNEADDSFALVQHLLTPSFDVRGVIAGHYEGRFREGRNMLEPLGMWPPRKGPMTKFFEGEGTSMQQSLEEIEQVMKLCEIEDIPLLRGCKEPLSKEQEAPESEGVRFIIEEAMREEERPLYLLLQGCLTDLAAALNTRPDIAERLTAVWIGGGAYPKGGVEFNLMQDITAARVVFASPIKLWQIPVNVYSEVEVSLAELMLHVEPCGEIGRYLFEQLSECNELLSDLQGIGRKGENWCLGDQPSAAVLLQSEERSSYHIERAPEIGEDFRYHPNPDGKEIRVYDRIDIRRLLEDFYAKLALCYKVGREKAERSRCNVAGS